MSTIQPKLTVGQPNDKYEQEADRIADEVMCMPEPPVQRQSESEEEDKEEELVQAKPQITSLVQRQIEPEEKGPVKEGEEESTTQGKPLADQIARLVQRQIEPENEEEQEEIEPVEEEVIQTTSNGLNTPRSTPKLVACIQNLKTVGQPLPQSERAFFEPRFGRDLSHARIHTNDRAAELAQAVNARALTVGREVIFNTGKYQPSTTEGKNLLAHELTHVIQQKSEQGSNSVIAPGNCSMIARKVSSATKKVHKTLFVESPFRATCKKWRSKATTKHPKTTGQLMVEEFRDNLNAYIKADPMSIAGDVTPHIGETDVDKMAVSVNKKISTHFGSHIKASLSDSDIQKRVQILPKKKTLLPDFLKKWLANRLYMWSSIADYCVDESDKRFQKVLSDILADTTMDKHIRIMASRQGAFFEGVGKSRGVFLHKGLQPAQAEATLIHEIVHFYAHPNYRTWNDKMVAPRFCNEGFTEFLARQVMSSSMKSGRKSYQKRFEFIRDKVAKYVSVDNIAAAFFAGMVWKVENISKAAKSLFRTFTKSSQRLK